MQRIGYTIHHPLEGLFESLLRPLIIAVSLELFLWRLLSNLGAPTGTDWAYTIISFLRSVAPLTLNFANFLATIAGVLASLELLGSTKNLAKISGFLMLVLVQLGLLLSLLSITQDLWFVYQGIFLIATFTFGLNLAMTNGFAPKLLAFSLLGSYFFSFYYKVAPMLHWYLGFPVSLRNEALAAGEAFAVGSMLFLSLSLRKEIWAIRGKQAMGRAVVASIPVVIFLLVYLRSPWLTTAFSIFAFGFSLYLPPFVYAAMLWFLAYVMLSSSSIGSHVIYGLSLLILGGIMLQHHYLNILTALGLFLLSYLGWRGSTQASKQARKNDLKAVVI